MLTQKPATSTYPTEDAANEPATTIAELEQALVETTGGALQTGAVLSRIAVMMVGSEWLNAWAIADAISLEKDEAVPAGAAVTVVVAVEEVGDEVHVHVVAITPAVKLL